MISNRSWIVPDPAFLTVLHEMALVELAVDLFYEAFRHGLDTASSSDRLADGIEQISSVLTCTAISLFK